MILPYDPHRRCPKCGATNPKIVTHHGILSPFFTSGEPFSACRTCAGEAVLFQLSAEHLLLFCSGCEHARVEWPLDRAAP